MKTLIRERFKVYRATNADSGGCTHVWASIRLLTACVPAERSRAIGNGPRASNPKTRGKTPFNQRLQCRMIFSL
jgi:hypothetical protein